MPGESPTHSGRWLALLGIGFFLIAPALSTLALMDANGQSGDYPGWPLLFFGWIGTMGVLDGKLDGIGWLANPLFLLGTLRLLMGKATSAITLLFTAALVSLASFTLKEVLLDEGGHTSHVVGYKQGFWLWMAAIWFNLLVAVVVSLIPIQAIQRLPESR